MSGWKSRWSWVRLVKTRHAKWMPSARPSSSACEETSIAQASSPASSMRRNVAWRSIASGVVRSTGSSTPPTTDLTVPSRPVCDSGRLEDRAREECGRRLAVRAGDAHDPQRRGRVAVEARRRRAHRRAHVGDDHLGHPEAERALADQRGGAALDGVGSEVVAVGLEPGHAEEERAGPDVRAAVVQAGDLHVGRVPAHQVAESHGPQATRDARQDAPPIAGESSGTAARTRRSSRTRAPPPRRRRSSPAARRPSPTRAGAGCATARSR